MTAGSASVKRDLLLETELRVRVEIVSKESLFKMRKDDTGKSRKAEKREVYRCLSRKLVTFDLMAKACTPSLSSSSKTLYTSWC